MKVCPNCGNQVSDDALFCVVCGSQMTGEEQQAQYGGQSAQGAAGNGTYGYSAQNQYAGGYDPYDHTSEFSTKDISDNKAFAMLGYLFGIAGVLVALLAASASKSEYILFHVRQALKFSIVGFLVTIVSVIFAITFIVPIAGLVFSVVLFVIRLICFFQVCSGKAKEPVILRSIPFLK